jgi:hypothetical protein
MRVMPPTITTSSISSLRIIQIMKVSQTLAGHPFSGKGRLQ